MKRDDVIERLCELCAYVGSIEFKEQKAHDCFCDGQYDNYFQFDECVLEYIENAVEEKLKNKIKE